jgi:hypothetical protein
VNVKICFSRINFNESFVSIYMLYFRLLNQMWIVNINTGVQKFFICIFTNSVEVGMMYMCLCNKAAFCFDNLMFTAIPSCIVTKEGYAVFRVLDKSIFRVKYI